MITPGLVIVMTTEYLKDPAAITAASFAIIEREAALDDLPARMRPVAARMIHTCGMISLIEHLAWSQGAAEKGSAALAAGAPVLTDVSMVAAGITAARLPADNRVICTLGEPGIAELAEVAATTRTAAALDHWAPHMKGAVVAIGNAPTALFRLLEMIRAGAPRPALVVATPPGFVGAAESKDALIANDLGLPYIAVTGRMGGSALAAAAVNAMAKEGL